MNALTHATAIILAGGLGTRLQGVVTNIPKAMADINGKPFIKILLDRLQYFGLCRVIICTGHFGHIIKNALGNTHGSIRLIYSTETFPLGTAGALRNAWHLLPAGPVLIINGDSYCHTDLEKFYTWFHEAKSTAGILLTHAADTSRFGRVEIDPIGRIISFHDKVQDGGPGMINAGIYLIDAEFIETIPWNKPCSLEGEVFPLLAGNRLAGYPTHDPFLDIGTKESYKNAPRFFAGLDSWL